MWQGETAVIIASGASLTQEDVNYCKGKARVAVVNDNYRLAPWADLLYACDMEWWDFHQPDFAGEKWTCDGEAAKKHGINYIAGHSRAGISLDPSYIHYGGNSGFQCCNLLVHRGVKKIILLGFDFQETGGKKHWFGDHPFPLHNMRNWANYTKHFNDAAQQFQQAGVEVVNCSRASALSCFRVSTIQAEI
jgi:hypothetical protein